MASTGGRIRPWTDTEDDGTGHSLVRPWRTTPSLRWQSNISRFHSTALCLHWHLLIWIQSCWESLSSFFEDPKETMKNKIFAPREASAWNRRTSKGTQELQKAHDREEHHRYCNALMLISCLPLSQAAPVSFFVTPVFKEREKQQKLIDRSGWLQGNSSGTD